MKKGKGKTKTKTKKVIRKSNTSKRNAFIFFWTIILFILSIPLLIFIHNQQDIRQRAAIKQTTTATTCIPSGGTCKPVGNCGSAETDAGEKDCSSDGSLTCCVPQSIGCLGSTTCNPTPTFTVAPSPVIPTDTPIFNGFVSTAPQPGSSNPTQTPSPVIPSTNTPNATSTPPISIIPSSMLPSLSTTPVNGTIDNSLLNELLNLIKKIFDFLSSLITNIGGGHNSGEKTNHSNHHNNDKD